jgi:GT2 family glycosyltransferase
MPKLIIALVNWNTKDLTRDCLKSLIAEIRDIDHEIWIVDNCSKDDSVDMIKNEFPEVKLIENKENAGFARANNQILSQAIGNYYFLLNTDTIIPPNSIRALVRFLDDNPDISAAAPKLTYADGKPQRPLRALPSLWNEFRDCLIYHFHPFKGIFRLLFNENNPRIISGDQPVRKEILSAACLLIRREVIENIGLLGEEYFLFSEENDYFTRMKKAGLKSCYLPGISIVHLIGKSRAKRGNIDSDTNFIKSKMIFFRKFYPFKLMILKFVFLLFFCWSYLIASAGKLLKKNREFDYQLYYRKLIGVLGSVK